MANCGTTEFADTSEEIESFAEVQRAPVASQGHMANCGTTEYADF